ncbi:NUDIX domain-containing protein [Candidatus Odyssella acanthamoebae]|uniref:NUDIX domain-containing protein n=1 Tax=Candidatus Odyssella acanthamoebae TaxID=91604 RepID=UPI0006906D86|nr:NUDIX domain-containing protein [Candidatus Paracaedibacter acanthamoebae]
MFFQGHRLKGIFLCLGGALTLSSCSATKTQPEGKQQRPVLTAAGVVHVCPDNKIAIIERGKFPYGLAMFGGHVEYESPQVAFVREAEEELNITQIDTLQLIGIHGEPGRDPRQHSVEATFTCTTPQVPVAGSDAKEVILYSVDDLNKKIDTMVFAADHKEILKKYLKNLKSCNPCKKVCNIGIPQHIPTVPTIKSVS